MQLLLLGVELDYRQGTLSLGIDKTAAGGNDCFVTEISSFISSDGFVTRISTVYAHLM
jgi:hypothetical protein